MARDDRGRGLDERAGLHVMGEIGDDRAVHFEVNLDGRTAQLGVGHGAGVRCGQPSKPGYIAGQFDDALVVDVVQHKMGSRITGHTRPWRAQPTILYMDGGGGNTVRPSRCRDCGTQASGGKSAPSAGDTPVSFKAGRTELTWTH